MKFKYNPNSINDKGKLALDIIVATSIIPAGKWILLKLKILAMIYVIKGTDLLNFFTTRK